MCVIQNHDLPKILLIVRLGGSALLEVFMRRIQILFLATILSACATTDPSNAVALETEVTSRVQEGMLLSTATSALTSIDFSCREGTSTNPRGKGIYECTRSRGPFWPPYSCIHRVLFESAAMGGTISKIQVFEPMCASL
jgi:hypothetical protein